MELAIERGLANWQCLNRPVNISKFGQRGIQLVSGLRQILLKPAVLQFSHSAFTVISTYLQAWRLSLCICVHCMAIVMCSIRIDRLKVLTLVSRIYLLWLMNCYRCAFIYFDNRNEYICTNLFGKFSGVLIAECSCFWWRVLKSRDCKQ